MMTADVKLKKYNTLQVKCPLLIMDHKQTEKFVRHICHVRDMKFQEIHFNRNRNTGQKLNFSSRKVPISSDRSLQNQEPIRFQICPFGKIAIFGSETQPKEYKYAAVPANYLQLCSYPTDTSVCSVG
jgi:hypothetical protein